MKKNIALVAGGYSGEYVVSIQSAAVIEAHLDRDRYQVYKISITRKGWFHTDGTGEHIAVDKNDFSLTLKGEKISFDAVFIGIHGTPGEDGKLQSYFDMLRIPYTSCGAVTSAITFNKSYCNKIVAALNVVAVARSMHLFREQPFSEEGIAGSLRFPVFVKPAEGGSSLGVSKVMTPSQGLGEAIERAFREDSQVLVEEFVAGRELTCGLFLSGGKVTALPVTEILSSKEFFDFEAKYTSGVSREVTPAEIAESMTTLVQTTSKKLYCALNCRGIVRMDFILEANTDKLYFLEANTMPGQSENSIVPQQVKAAGMTLQDFYGILIEDCLK
jgi:D-alanine-D-alanine ligase